MESRTRQMVQTHTHTHTRKLAKMEKKINKIIIIIHWNEGEGNKLIITLNELYHTQEEKKNSLKFRGGVECVENTWIAGKSKR